MSRLTIYPDDQPRNILRQTDEVTEIAAILGDELNVRFERWHFEAPLSADAEAGEILEIYRPHVDRLMGEAKAGSADVVKLSPDHPDAAKTRAQFLQEHTHSDDEVRYFIRGGGTFMIHENGRIYEISCSINDLISVPANAKHWLDIGERPDFIVLRLFTNTSGWAAQYTGNDIAARFPVASV